MTIGKTSPPLNQESPVSFTRLGALIDDSCFQNGIYKHSDEYGTGVPILRITDFDNHGRLISNSFKRVALSPQERSQYVIRQNDIVINRVNSLSHIGKSMLFPFMHEYPVFESNMMRIRINDECLLAPEYVAAVLQAGPARKHFRKVAKPAVAQASINQDDVRSVAIALYPKAKQRWIAQALSFWDLAVEKTGQLIVAKEQHYSHELLRLIGRGQHPQAQVGTFAEEVSTRNRGSNEARVLSVTNSRGFVLPQDQFERRVASADLSNYKVVHRGQYAYNPSRINVGSIARLDHWDDGVLSPMYVVFKIDEEKANSDYFLHWLNSHEARQRIKNSAQGSVRETVSFSEFAAITIPLPDKHRQNAIARYLNALRQEIDLLGQSVAALKTQKRGLMQKLLTGQRRLPIAEEVPA